MRSLAIVPVLLRGALVALVVVIGGFGPLDRSAEAALLLEVKKLLASDLEAGDRLGGSVSVSGDTAVVGACCEDAEGDDAGAAYVYEQDDGGAGNWGEMRKLTASHAEAGDLFGSSVAVSGDTVVVGAYQEDAEGDGAGAAYVFDLKAGSSGLSAVVVAGIAAGVAAGVLAVGGAGWYARRRLRG